MKPQAKGRGVIYHDWLRAEKKNKMLLLLQGYWKIWYYEVFKKQSGLIIRTAYVRK